jgi:hypothetical protein
MKLLVGSVISLILYVMTDYIFICMGTNCGYKISIGPKFTAPQLFFNCGNSGKYFSCCNALHYCYYLCWANDGTDWIRKWT